MPEKQPHTNAEYLRTQKDTLISAWQNLPPEHQATIALVLLTDVLDGQFGPWLQEAVRLQNANPEATTSPDKVVNIPTSLQPEHFRHLPLPFQPESEGGHALAQVRLHLPGSYRLWYPSAFDGEDLFFGLVVESEITCDYFSLSDLTQMRGPDDQPVQPDPTFTPHSLDDLIARHVQNLLQPPNDPTIK
ncbi:hypothetical protein ACFLYO_10155 [Chloroflexota bacterium]